MQTIKTKANIGIAWVIAFAVTLILGIILHLKGHGIIVQPCGVLKTVHWIFGYTMTVLLFIHWAQFRENQMVLRRHLVSNYIVLSHTAYRYGQAAYARQDSSSRIVALWAWHRHEHHRHHSPHTRTSGMDQNEEIRQEIENIK